MQITAAKNSQKITAASIKLIKAVCVSYVGFLVVNVCNHGERCETPCTSVKSTSSKFYNETLNAVCTCPCMLRFPSDNDR